MRASYASLVLLASALACGGDGGGAPTGNTPSVAPKDTVSTIQDIFVPNLLTIRAGSTVVFAFGGGREHNAFFDRSVPGAPADIPTTKDVYVARTFPTRGAFKFDCVLHPGMRGEIDVQ